MAEGHNIGVMYGGTWRSLGYYSGGTTLTTNYTANKSTAGGIALVLCSNQGSESLTYIRAGLYLIKFAYSNSTTIGVTHVSGDNTWTFGVSNNLVTITGGSTNWANWAVILSNKN
jgi:hypothetical protein